MGLQIWRMAYVTFFYDYMKEIVFIGSGLSSGGAEHQCSQLMNMLVERGYNVTYASFGDVKDHYLVSPLVKRVQLAPEKSTSRKILAVELYLLRVKADVVFAFSQRLSVLTLFPMLLRQKVKVISGERNFTISEPDKFERILVKTGIYKRANCIVPNNYSQGRYLAEKMPSIKKKIKVITNYTDINLYQSSPVPNNEITRLGVFCRFEEQKNFHRFIEAVYLLRREVERPFRIDWYGNRCFKSQMQKDYYEKGTEMIQECHLDDVLFLHDATKDVPKLIPQFDALCLPSLHEGFSNSISEYICCGRPVICSDVSDNSVMVHERENGFLFNPLDVNDIVRALTGYLQTTHTERSIFGQRSREIAEKLFDKSRFINDYIKLIEA